VLCAGERPAFSPRRLQITNTKVSMNRQKEPQNSTALLSFWFKKLG
jgi:hypothetical protein